VLLVFLVMLSVPLNAWLQDIQGDWKGVIEIPGSPLEVTVHITTGDALEATMDIPAQNTWKMKLHPVSFDASKNELSFRLPDVPGDASYTGNCDGDAINGTFMQGGYSFALNLKRESAEDKQREGERVALFVNRFRSLADTIRQVYKVPGMAIAVVRSGKVLLLEGLGFADVEAGRKVEPTTVFAIGSCTKAFTAFLAAQQVKEGDFTWKTPVHELYPGFRMQDEYSTMHMTMEDLLSHRSGLPRHDFMWYGSAFSRLEMLDRLQYLEPSAELRTTWQYQNLMFMTAGYVSGRVEGTSWEEALADKVLKPLNIPEDAHRIERLSGTSAAQPYRKQDDKVSAIPVRNIEAIGPAGSLNLNAEEMAGWVQMLLAKGKVSDQEVFDAQVVNDVFRPRAIMQERRGANTSPLLYSLGWITFDYKGHNVVQHGGNIDGFSALVQMMPYDDMGVVILTNLDATNAVNVLAMCATELWLGEKVPDLAELMKEPEVEEKPEVKPTASQPVRTLKEYAGSYAHPGYGIIKISISADGKSLSGSYNTFQFPLSHLHLETFSAYLEEVDERIPVHFLANANGGVEKLEIVMEPSLDPVSFKRQPDSAFYDVEYLKQFEGTYTFTDKTTLQIKTSAKGLTAIIEGQPPLMLKPEKEDWFSFEILTGYRVEFVRNKKGEVVSVISHQPDGDYKADRKK
jgi:CubicO group peptidase (beta-lactamase class C family)